ncbi:MAG: hypothetical protein AAGL69_00960 [Pseudomonadota bacterium]
MSLRKTTIGLVLFATLNIVGCALPEQAPKEPLKPASFDYVPPATASAGNAGMKIILVNPSYASDFEGSGVEPYVSFGSSMANDFEEVLSARGYTVYGPYETYDEIVYSEKEIADLVLLIDIDMDQSHSMERRQQATLAGLLGGANNPNSTVYKLDGSMRITGKLTMKAREPQSGEQMWVKSVEIPPKQYNVTSQDAWSATAIASNQHYNDAGIFNPTVDTLQGVYNDSLAKAYTYLDPRELQQLRPQIDRIKKRIRY